MADLLIPFAIVATGAFACLKGIINDIRKIRRSGSKGFIVAGILIAAFVYIVPPTYIWRDTFALDDLKVATVTLDSHIHFDERRSLLVGFVFSDSCFTLNGSEKYWDFSPCGSGGNILDGCEGKQITIWYKKYKVYQVEADGEIIFSIENSNQRIILNNITCLIWYILLMSCFLPISTFIDRRSAKGRRATKLRENEKEQILKRFCNNCGAELGKILEIHNVMEYEQYKFCARCGLDSDPVMPTKRWDRHGKRFAIISAAMLLITTVISAIAIVNDNIPFALIILAILMVVFGVFFLMIKFCPRCGRMYEKENFCSNCGTNLNRH